MLIVEGSVSTVSVRSTVENGSAFRAEQVGPASGLASCFGSVMIGRVVLRLTVLVDGEEVDREANRSERLHAVLDFGRYCLCQARANDDIQFGVGPRHESQAPLMHDDAAPSTRGNAVRTLETRRHRAFVPLRARPNPPNAVG
jgi:hypothetical protein